mmetsp:Transcript_9660/g.24607  ORF Transcript_9660/g.24607 Transcript_9660/m.24607 type:complete len:237 (-) Transcript_9660:586-1296(-)
MPQLMPGSGAHIVPMSASAALTPGTTPSSGSSVSRRAWMPFRCAAPSTATTVVPSGASRQASLTLRARMSLRFSRRPTRKQRDRRTTCITSRNANKIVINVSWGVAMYAPPTSVPIGTRLSSWSRPARVPKAGKANRGERMSIPSGYRSSETGRQSSKRGSRKRSAGERLGTPGTPANSRRYPRSRSLASRRQPPTGLSASTTVARARAARSPVTSAIGWSPSTSVPRPAAASTAA